MKGGAMGFITRAVNRSLFSKGKYEREQELTGTATIFRTSVDTSEIKRQLKAHVRTVESLPTLITRDLAIEQETDSAIVYHYGNKMKTFFRSAVQMDGQSARYRILSWTQIDGVSTDVDAMENLRNSIVCAFKAADPNVEVSSVANE
jgi:hypothetical protein